MSDIDIVVNVGAEIFWKEPPASTEERMLREAAIVRLQAIASKFNEPLMDILKTKHHSSWR